jgi:hypothetical protein
MTYSRGCAWGSVFLSCHPNLFPNFHLHRRLTLTNHRDMGSSEHGEMLFFPGLVPAAADEMRPRFSLTATADEAGSCRILYPTSDDDDIEPTICDGHSISMAL